LVTKNQSNVLSVLIVDDNASVRSALRSIIKLDGHIVVGDASDGKTALTLFRQLKPDAIILDMVMPGTDSLAVMAEIREAGLATPVLVITDTDDQATLQQAFALGAIDSVTKPLNADRILTTLSQISRQVRSGKAAATGQHSTAAGGEPSSARAVIIDSHPEARQFLKVLLGAANVNVVAEAEDGFEGLRSVEEHLPDLVFLDVDMAEINGLNVLRCLRAVHADLKVIMATSRSEGEIVKEALSQGVAGYLLKPFDAGKVLASVRKALGRH